MRWDQIISEGGRVWFERPSDAEIRREHDEVGYQLVADAEQPFLRPDVRDRLRQLQDLRSFRQAVRGGIVRPVRPDEVGGIDNTGDRWEASNWSPDKNRRVKQLYRSGGRVSMRIVLWNTVTGERHLLAGHHRLTYNSDVRGQPTNVLFLPYTS